MGFVRSASPSAHGSNRLKKCYPTSEFLDIKVLAANCRRDENDVSSVPVVQH